MIKIGVIADDFTGATDIASFLVENGLPTVQINGVPTGKMPEAIDALVISLKTRGLNSIEYSSTSEPVTRVTGKKTIAQLSRFSLASLYRERNHDQDWRYRR